MDDGSRVGFLRDQFEAQCFFLDVTGRRHQELWSLFHNYSDVAELTEKRFCGRTVIFIQLLLRKFHINQISKRQILLQRLTRPHAVRRLHNRSDVVNNLIRIQG